MSTLIGNLIELVNMIFAVIVKPNYGASSTSLSILDYLYTGDVTNTFIVKGVLLLTFGIGLCGVSIGILKRFLWKS